MKILIVGGGMGGTILANNLARRLTSELRNGKVQLTMLTASERHMYQPGLLYLAIGRMTPEELYRDQASLLEPGIGLHVDPVEEFRLDKNEVKTKSGKVHGYDMLAIATGARPTPEEIPGSMSNEVRDPPVVMDQSCRAMVIWSKKTRRETSATRAPNPARPLV